MKVLSPNRTLVVVAIIGILAAVGVVAYNGYTSSAKKSAVRNNFKSVVKYINNELMKCELGELKIMSGTLNCPQGNTFGTGIINYIQGFLKQVIIFSEILTIMDFKSIQGILHNRDEDVGYIKLNLVNVGSNQFIVKVKSCVKLPCSDASNHIEELIVSDMIGR